MISSPSAADPAAFRAGICWPPAWRRTWPPRLRNRWGSARHDPGVQPCTRMYNHAMRRINGSEARQTLPAQVDRVAAGEEVSIPRHGRVGAVLVRPDVLASRRASAAWDRSAHVAALLETARTQPVRTAAIDDERAGQLAEAARASRSGR